MARDEWPGIAPKVLTGFNQMLAGDFRQTIERFLAIQAMGSEHARDDIRQLRHWLAERPAPQFAALEAGLTLLADIDLREPLRGAGSALVADLWPTGFIGTQGGHSPAGQSLPCQPQRDA